jgi:class 3 adenylate cyclase
MDIHELPGVTAEDVAKAHLADLEIQGKHNVEYIKYWANEACGKVFCLVNAPTADAASQVHREAHGLVAGKIIEVPPDLAEGFLGGGEINQGGAALVPGARAPELDPGIRTILFTDIVGSTMLTQSIGDEAAMTLFQAHDRIVRDALSAVGGREVKHTGDGIMASFVSAAAAIKCATRIQSELAGDQKESRRHPIKVRIGVAAGEPVEHHDDLFGCTVQLAARLCAHAEPEQIIVSNVVAELCIGKGVVFEELGDIPLKGFDRPVRAHAVQWHEQATPPRV